MARDRKRAKQRQRARRSSAAAAAARLAYRARPAATRAAADESPKRRGREPPELGRGGAQLAARSAGAGRRPRRRGRARRRRVQEPGAPSAELDEKEPDLDERDEEPTLEEAAAEDAADAAARRARAAAPPRRRERAQRGQPLHQLPAGELGRAPTGTVARPPAGRPGHRGRHRLRHRRRRLPRPAGLRLLEDSSTPSSRATSTDPRIEHVPLVRRQHLLRSREQGQAQPRAPRRLARASSAPCARSSSRPSPSRR